MDASRRTIEELYPASEKQAERVATPGGHTLDELTLENVLEGKLSAEDVGILPSSLRLQAEVARAAGRGPLTDNFERGAELVGVPQDDLFETYEMLRPGRARNKAELLELAARYRTRHDAPHIAALIEDAAETYERRNLYRKRF